MQLTSNGPMAVAGGPTYSYGAGDGGAHTFSVALGDSVAFGAQMGYAPVPDGTPDWRNPAAVRCTLTASDTTGAAMPGQREVDVSGEYCDGADNNADSATDDAFPELGTQGPNGGTYRCAADGLRLEEGF